MANGFRRDEWPEHMRATKRKPIAKISKEDGGRARAKRAHESGANCGVYIPGIVTYNCFIVPIEHRLYPTDRSLGFYSGLIYRIDCRVLFLPRYRIEQECLRFIFLLRDGLKT